MQTHRCCQPQHAYSRYLLLLLGRAIDAPLIQILTACGMAHLLHRRLTTFYRDQHRSAEKAARAFEFTLHPAHTM